MKKQPEWLRDVADPHLLSEKAVERKIIGLYEMFGVWVVKFSQPHSARGQTLGIPDLRCYAVEGRWWHEVKAWGKKQSEGQLEFAAKAVSYGEVVIVGGVNTAIRTLRNLKIANVEEIDGHW